jgi:lipopolysaccharide/colanic/teichoic acid biosynthesis glycosyltransferase
MGADQWAQRHRLERKLALDVWYVDHWSLMLDMIILARTLRNVLLRQGISNPAHATMPEFLGGGK